MADEALTAGAVARRLGVAVTTLRTWHQRYGLGPSQHIPGQHRRYTSEDLSRLEVMRRLTAQGVSPAEAAAWARRVSLPADHDDPPPVDPGTPALLDPGASAPLDPGASAAPEPEAGRPEPGPVPLRAGVRDGGGTAIPVGRAGPAARGLARAAMRLDAPALREILQYEIAGRGVIDAWEQVIMPVLLGIGERYEATRRFIDVEHLTSRCITEVLGSVARPGMSQVPRVLLCCADEEQHTLPLEALAAALAEHGTPSRLLGARVPPEALADAIARTGPAALVVWSQLPHTGHRDQLDRLLLGPRRPFLVAAAGPGWSVDELPDEIPLLESLSEAVRVVTAAVEATRRAG